MPMETSIEDRQLIVAQSCFQSPQACYSAFYRALLQDGVAVESITPNPENAGVTVTLARWVEQGDRAQIEDIAAQIGASEEPVTYTELVEMIEVKSAEIAEQADVITDLTTRLTTLEATIAALQAALTS
jgi:hypothetical protein